MSPLVGEIKRGWGTLKSYSPQTWGARGARFLILELLRRSVYTVAQKLRF